MKEKCLIIVDVQNDFCDGALAVTGGRTVADSIPQFVQQNTFDSVLITKDWHPEDHCSFIKFGGSWPSHCIMGTRGAELAFDTSSIYKNIHNVQVVCKGSDKRYECYGIPVPHTFNNSNYYFIGIALDYCVKECAIATAKAYPESKCYIIEDLCASVKSMLDEENRNNFMKSISTYKNIELIRSV